MITLNVNNRTVEVEDGATIAAAILESGYGCFRRSSSGEPRGPLCGMGICFECRVTIDGVPHRRSCTTLADEGMEVVTDE